MNDDAVDLLKAGGAEGIERFTQAHALLGPAAGTDCAALLGTRPFRSRPAAAATARVGPVKATERGSVMKQRLDFITLGVPDLAEARRFYLEGLGWEATLDLPGQIVFLQVGYGLTLGLFDAGELAADIGGGAEVRPGTAPVTFSHNVDSPEEVVAVLDRAQAAGATILKPAQRADFGGFHGYFADPAGFRWEVAHNPGWSVDADGRVTIVPIEP